MLDNDYLTQLPTNRLLAANQICSDFLGKRLFDHEEDIAHALQVLLEDCLPKDWQSELRDPSDDAAGWFAKPKPKPTARDKIILMHRHVKALAAKESISRPRVINPYLIELPSADVEKVDALLTKARSMIREEFDIDDDHRRKLLFPINVMQDEVRRSQGDYRAFLNGVIDVADLVAEYGGQVRPVLPVVRDAFAVVDALRRKKEAIDAARPESEQKEAPKSLPKPA